MALISKSDFLNAFSNMPVGTLKRLYDYSQYLVIPEEDLLTNVTQRQMVAKAMSLADQFFPEWTDRSDSDFGKFLIELIGLFSEKDFYYINSFANESFISKARIYSDVFIKAIELGYRPRLNFSASTTATVTFVAGANDFTYLPGSLIVKFVSGQSFTNVAPFTVLASGVPSAMSIQLFEGTLKTNNYSFNGYRVDIRDENIDVRNLSVVIDGVLWSRVDVFGQSDFQSKHYVVLPEENGYVSIYFGSDGYGQTPPIGANVVATYLKTLGKSGNNANGITTIDKSSTTRKATLVTCTAPTGGDTAETITELRQNTQNYFSTRFVVNTVDAVKRWLLLQPEVKKAGCYCQGNNIYFFIVPPDGSIATPATLTALTNRLTPFVSTGYNVYGQATTYVTASPIDVDVYYLAGYNEAETMQRVKEIISDYTNPLIGGDYDKNFNMNEVEYLCKSQITGLQNIVFNLINGVVAANVPVGVNQILQTTATSNIITHPIPVV